MIYDKQKKVSWTTDTVDNEYLNKKKSKCCCIYQKPHNFDESSSEDEHEDKDCALCKGHRKTDYNSLREKQQPDSGCTETEYHESKDGKNDN